MVRYILGVDEAGAGALAGPLVVGAVLIPESFEFDKLKDPKTMTPGSRQKAFARFITMNIPWATSWGSCEKVDSQGVWGAWSQCVYRAVRMVLCPGSLEHTQIIIDGDRRVDWTYSTALGSRVMKQVTYLPKADTSVLAVQLAALVAKVSRDRHMQLLGDYARGDYQLGQNAGYGSETHLDALTRFGATPVHRKTFKRVPKDSVV